MTDHVGSVDHSALGAADSDGLADDQRGHVFGDVAGGVGFDEQVEVAGLVVAGDWGVGADDFFVGVVGLREGGGDGDVLANREAEDGGWGGEFEAVAGRY